MRFILFAALCLSALPALAAPPPTPEILGSFGKWTAYRHMEGKNKPVCYMAAPPVKTIGAPAKRGPVFLMITHRPADKTVNVVSHIAGYTYDKKTAILARVDGQDYLMVPNGDEAWTPTQKSDTTLADALRHGGQVDIIGVSAKKAHTVDSYTLKNSGKAFEAIDRACGVAP